MTARILATFALALAFAVAPAFAADEKPDTPTTLKGGKVVSVEEAKALVDKKGSTLFDTRTVLNFGKGHIPGATVAAYKEKSDFKVDFDASQDQFDLSKLPADKNATIVFYSDSPKGWKSYKAAILTIRAGYKNVLWMREGFNGWTAKSYPVEQ